MSHDVSQFQFFIDPGLQSTEHETCRHTEYFIRPKYCVS